MRLGGPELVLRPMTGSGWPRQGLAVGGSPDFSLGKVTSMVEGTAFDSATVRGYVAEIDELTNVITALLKGDSPDFDEVDRAMERQARAAFRVVGAVRVWLIDAAFDAGKPTV